MKKKSATKSKPVATAKRATKATARKKPEENIPAAKGKSPPAMAENGKPKKSAADVQSMFSGPNADAAAVDFLQRRGYAINKNQWSKLSDGQRNEARRWMEDISHGKPHTMPPFMTDFDTNGGTRPGGGVIRPEDQPEPFFVAVDFGRVGYEDSGSVPGLIHKSCLSAADAEKLLCNTRVKVLIELRDNAERKSLLKEPTNPRFEFEMDSKGFRSSKDGWHLTFKLGIALDRLAELGKFAGQTGRAELTRLGEIEGKAESNGQGPHPDVEEGKHKPHGTPVLDAAAKARKEAKATPKLIPDSDDPDELFVLPQEPNSLFIARVEPDGAKWKAGCEVRFVSGEFTEDENSFADEAKTSQTTLEYAVTAVVERWIGYLQKRPDGDWKKPIADLQAYLARLRAGDSPEKIDAEITTNFQGTTHAANTDETAAPTPGADAVPGDEPEDDEEGEETEE